MRTVGLNTHIWNNAIRSLLLLAGFPVLLLILTYGFAVVAEALSGDVTVGEGLRNAFHNIPNFLPIAIGGALVWFVIAFFINTRVIGALTGARSVERKDEPRLYNLLENLCISRGLPTPRLRIIESPGLNAFASGVVKSQYTVTVTRGLLDTLDDAELEAVLAHELTHIRNGDVRLLMVATVFVGIIALVTDIIGRGGRFVRLGGIGSRSSSSSRKGGGGAAIVLILIAVACFVLARLLATVVRFALSRRREYMADAGSVELTRNPDAMISALRKIEGRSTLERAPTDVRPMFFDNEPGGSVGFLGGLFATHPSIADRVQAIVSFAGGRDPGPRAEALPAPEAAPAKGPWS